MPTYEYRCKTCGHELEIVQSFTDDALTTCAACGGPLRKVFGNVGIAFKGTGFYKNDSRGKKASATAGADKPSGDASTPSSDAPKKDAATPATSTPSKGDAAKSGAKKSGTAASTASPT